MPLETCPTHTENNGPNKLARSSIVSCVPLLGSSPLTTEGVRARWTSVGGERYRADTVPERFFHVKTRTTLKKAAPEKSEHLCYGWRYSM